MHIEVKQLVKRFGDLKASDQISFQIESGKLIGLLGPSGGGKTTILRMLAGLEFPDAGEIYFHGKLVNQEPPQKRGVGFVFQNYALFKHMTVFDNIAFGLKVQKKSKTEIKQRVEELLELTGLGKLGQRLPHQLSGGQRQRVAFARALAPEPQLLLLDEPFAAIDAKVRKELRTWLKEMIQRVGITTIFVTHDQDEAVEVADEIIIINQGRLEQAGTPTEIYQQPKTSFVANFIGESILLDDYTMFKGFNHYLTDAKAMIRPEFVETGTKSEIPFPSAAEKGTIRSVSFRGTAWQLEIEVRGHRLFSRRSLELPELKVGDEAYVFIHRMYIFNESAHLMMENLNKVDPQPVHI